MKEVLYTRRLLFSIALLTAFGSGSNIAWAQVNPNVTAKTKTLYSNLKKMQNTGNFLFGQEFFNSYRFNSGSAQGDKTYSDAKAITGSHPAVLGSDFHYYLEKGATERSYHTEAVKYAFQQGYVITMDWHISARGTTSYSFTGSPANLATNIATDSSSSDGQWYLRELDKVIKIMNEDFIVNGDTIPIVFRPWHEMNGNWFWWGTSAISAANFKLLYALTVNYVKMRTKHVLFLWTPNTPFDLSRYPGDDYVDVLGLDYYQISASSLQSQLGMLVDYVQAHGKVAVLSETGSTDNSDNASLYWKNTLLPAILNDPAGKAKKIAWMLTWINASWSIPYVPYSSTGSMAKQSFIDFKNSPNVIFGDEMLFDMYTFTGVIAGVTPEVSHELHVYPIPSSGNITINVKEFGKPASIIFYDAAGKSVYQIQILQDEITLNIKDILKAGVYILKASNHNKMAMTKLVLN